MLNYVMRDKAISARPTSSWLTSLGDIFEFPNRQLVVVISEDCEDEIRMEVMQEGEEDRTMRSG
jgi:hypothetical protein